MAVTMSAKVTKDGATLALNRLTGGGSGGGASRAAVSGQRIADTAAKAMVHEFLPDVFYSNLYNWKKTVRPGQPLLDTGTHLASGFVYSTSGAVATIKNLFKYAHVHDRGMTIRAKSAKNLRFKVRGVGWFSKKEVVIPQRRFMYWSALARDLVMRRVREMLARARAGT
jgi:phage gpG-like protein